VVFSSLNVSIIPPGELNITQYLRPKVSGNISDLDPKTLNNAPTSVSFYKNSSEILVIF
jgi:hypothetical protein